MLRIGEVASACGVSDDTVRHYEARGVIPPPERGANGYRRYPPETIDRIRTIRRALAIGFTLEELGRIYRQREAGKPPCRLVREAGAKKLAEIDQKIAELEALREVMTATIRSWDERLEGTAAGEPAYLLDSLMTGEHDDDPYEHAPSSHSRGRR